MFSWVKRGFLVLYLNIQVYWIYLNFIKSTSFNQLQEVKRMYFFLQSETYSSFCKANSSSNVVIARSTQVPRFMIILFAEGAFKVKRTYTPIENCGVSSCIGFLWEWQACLRKQLDHKTLILELAGKCSFWCIYEQIMNHTCYIYLRVNKIALK